MNSTTLPSFWACYHRLPAHIRQAARDAFHQFEVDPHHPGLHFHRLRWDPSYWSARVTGNYRAVGILRGDTITWVWIGSHADFDQIFPR